MANEHLTCRINSVEKLSDKISAFELKAIDSQFMGITPGAHLDVLLADNLIRQYSIFSSSDDNTICRIAVKREDSGRGGSLQMHQLVAGDLLKVSQPRNNFELESHSEHYTLIAGGIGVTPIFPMVGKLTQLGKEFDIYYLIQSAEDAAFTDLFNNIDLGRKFHLHITDESGLLDFSSVFEKLLHNRSYTLADLNP